ncbi:hypothetical protein [Colwellia sp. PAMC 21821]|uniref:hypothetical protein n=1 Tax=Colwellia sp. PAMC 21821 TaxID=1816219 RepID=UPI0009BD2F8A|nr:hypothetical protein [Colwellia sp. PAMC 21821]ARD45593.1 hypothetical protein A3Q33_15670 [Colwellia sp. PAMC 21821]
MSTEIKISGAIFKCQADEDIFYQRLSQVKGIEKIITNDFSQLVSVSTINKHQAISDIVAICDMWHATMETK